MIGLEDLTASPELRDAYKKLPQDVRKNILHMAVKDTSEIVEYLMCTCGLDKGFRVGKLMQNYKAVYSRIDNALVNPGKRRDPLPGFAFMFLFAERQEWLIPVKKAWDEASPEKQSEAVIGALEKMKDECEADPLWPFCDAFCRIGAAHVFPGLELRKVKNEPPSENDASEAPEAPEATDPFVDISNLYTQAATLLGEVAQAKAIKREDLNAAIDQMERLGGELRGRLEELSKGVEGTNIRWESLEELKRNMADLEELRRLRGEATNMRSRLESVRSFLLRISNLRIRLRQRREDLLRLKEEAVQQLAAAAIKETPPSLPGPGDGEDWFKSAFALTDDDLDQLLAELEGMALGALGRFVGNSSWDELELLQGTSSPEDVIASRIALSVVHLTGETVPPEPKAPATTTPAPLEKVQPSVPSDSASEGAGSRMECVRGAEVQSSLPGTEVEPVSKPPVPQPRRPVVSSHEEQNLGLEQLAEAEQSAQPVRRLRIIESLAEQGRWFVASQYVEACPGDDGLPPAALFRIIGLQPKLKGPDGPVAANISHLLRGLNKSASERRAEVLLWWAACALPALLAPSTEAVGFLRSLRLSEFAPSLDETTQAITRLTDNVRTINVTILHGGRARAEWERRLDEVRDKVREFRRTAALQTIVFPPATDVWRRLNQSGLIAQLGALILANEATTVPRVGEILAILKDERKYHKLIDDTHWDLEATKRDRIEARALHQLNEKVRPLIQHATAWITLHGQQPPEADFITRQIAEFRRKIQGLTSRLQEETSELSATDDALQRVAAGAVTISIDLLRRVLDGSEIWSEEEPDPGELMAAQLLAIPEISLNENWVVETPVDVLRATVEQNMDRKLDLEDTFRKRLKLGDLLGAGQVLAQIENDNHPASSCLRTEFGDAEINHPRHLAQELNRITGALAGARALGLLAESEAAEIETGLVEQAKAIETTKRFDRVRSSLGDWEQRLAEKRRTRTQEVLKEIEELRPAPAQTDIERLKNLAQAGDILTVREYLSRLRATGELKTGVEDIRDPLRDFFPGTAKAIQDKLDEVKDLSQARRALESSSEFAGLNFGKVSGAQMQEALNMLSAWQILKQSRSVRNDALRTLVEMLGFEVKDVKKLQTGARETTEIECTPICDRKICPIPKFGSEAAGHYTFLHLWDRPSEDAVVQAVGETAGKQKPVIVIYYGRLSEQRRRDLSRLCREKLRTFLLLDEILLFFLCGERGLRLPAFFRCSLPFTYADPFITAASLVSAEMFYGRQRELADLQELGRGGCFVYGGRQLGKTALLREAQRRFHRPEYQRFGLWLDLLNEGIGTESEPAALWDHLEREFSQWPGFRAIKVGSGSKYPDKRFQEKLKAWLKEAPERRVLLLLDEADRFLERDATNDFAESRKLKGLMDSTERRFKIVFAGLHNVQRTTRQSNHPLAHLGEPINVSSFSNNGEWKEAFSLASDPLCALGYRFDSADLVTRILALCNFYPSLMQQFSSRLLRRLNERVLQGPPFAISEQDVEEIYQDPELRRFIESRFQLTLQLDPRYHLLAYVLALKFHEEPDRTSLGFKLEELRASASQFWQGGFSQLTDEEFATIVDEMCGLGVLRSTEPGRYALRNPNLLLLLGTRERIVNELLNGPRKTAEYAPRTFHSRRSNHEYERHPLTLAEEARLFGLETGCLIAVGSPVLGIDNLLITARERKHPDIKLETVSEPKHFDEVLSRLQKLLAGKDDNTTVFWLQPETEWTFEWFRQARTICDSQKKGNRNVRVVFSTRPMMWWTQVAKRPAEVEVSAAELLTLSKWREDFIRPWLDECGFPTAEDELCPRVLEVTGGWSGWLYKLVDLFHTRKDWRKALADLEQWLESPENQPELRSKYGLPNDQKCGMLKTLRGMRQLQLNDEEPLHESDFLEYSDALQVEIPEIDRLVRWACDLRLMEKVDGRTWTWDKVFVRHLGT